VKTDRRAEGAPRGIWQLAALAAALAALAAASCGPKETAVCGEEEHLVVVPSTSETDYDVSLELTPKVTDQAVARVARSCGLLTVGILDGRPDANLALDQEKLKPRDEDERRARPGKVTEDLIEKGDEFVQSQLIVPLEEHGENGGSPFLAGLAKIGGEVESQGWLLPTVVLIGDGLVVEPSPDDGEMINLGKEEVDPKRLDGFVDMLRELEGACVILVGAGATSEIPGRRIRASQDAMEKVLGEAGVEFVAVRSPIVPAGC